MAISNSDQMIGIRDELRGKRKPQLENQSKRAKVRFSVLITISSIMMAGSVLGPLESPTKVAVLLLSSGLLILATREAAKLNLVEAQLWRDRQPLKDASADQVIGSGVIGDASRYWRDHIELSKKFNVALLATLLAFGSGMVWRAVTDQFDQALLTLGYICVGTGIALVTAAVWSLIAVFMHRSAFVRDYQVWNEAATLEEAKDAYRGVIAFT
jgi:hypothetical protein